MKQDFEDLDGVLPFLRPCAFLKVTHIVLKIVVSVSQGFAMSMSLRKKKQSTKKWMKPINTSHLSLG